MEIFFLIVVVFTPKKVFTDMKLLKNVIKTIVDSFTAAIVLYITLNYFNHLF